MTIAGNSVNGSGFYDPGHGFANRLQVAITGGVTVNSYNVYQSNHAYFN